MATAKIWWYFGHVGDEKNTRTMLAREPYIDREQVTPSGTAASSNAAPFGARLARIEVSTATRFRVRPNGDTTDADANDPPLFSGGDLQGWNWVHVPAGATISLIEAA